MSSVTLAHSLKMGNNNKKENENTKARRISNATLKKHKEDNRHPKFNRKRAQSFTGNGKFCPPYKRRKKESIIPPTKFLLGGNICDPLNLNSMQDEEINRAMNAVTPKSSPLPTPKHRKEAIEVIIPPNPSDPLNLNNLNDADYEKRLMSPLKRNGKKRNRGRNRKKSSATDPNKSEELKTDESLADEVIPVVEKVEEKMDAEPPKKDPTPSKSPQEPHRPKEEPPVKEQKLKLKIKSLDEAKDKRMRKLDIKDKIVSPVIPQPGAWKSRPQYRPNHHDKKKKQQKQPNFKDKNARFQYGNYNRYYGYRNHEERDTRLTVFTQRKELFYQKDVLDVGCNIGHITLSVARDFGARSVTGIDIDKKLIGIARKNIKHYVNCAQSPAQTDDGERKKNDANIFPMSMLINYGPVDIPGFENPNKHKGFPYNVTFVQGNYVVDDDLLSVNQKHHFDTILCLSVTKWIHLNFGDAGLKRCFKRMFAQLKPGGVLILEPQNWNSYVKKKTLTEKIYKNFHAIELKPQMFTQYLLSSEVGFQTCEVISVPPHPSKGFQRPIYLYTKAQQTPSPAETSPPPSTSMDVTVTEGSCDVNVDAACKSRDERRPSMEQQERGRRSSYDQQQEMERQKMERDLFPSDARHVGNFSDRSQRSNESFCNYDQLENVYAPSATPCYDTPSHNSATSPFSEPEKMCYVDINIDNYQPTKIDSEERRSSEETHEPEDNEARTSPKSQEDKT